MNKKIKFGTSGWRAIIAENFTFENVRIVSQAVADYINEKNLAEKGVIIGYDTRFMAEDFAREVASVIAANKIKVLFCNRDTPTPVIAYDIIKNKRAGGINITASHNSYKYGGFKFSPDWGGPALPETTRWIEKRITELLDSTIPYKFEKFSTMVDSGIIEPFNPAPQYFEQLSSIIDFPAIKEAGLKIMYNPLHGTGRSYLDKILREFDVNVEVINDNLDPLFEGRAPDPSEENLKEMAKKLKAQRFDLGLATDGDADRYGILDKNGKYIKPNFILALLYDYFLTIRGEKGGVARSVATSHLADAVAIRYHEKVYETPVGFKYLGDLLSRGNAIIAGEESSGLSMRGHVPEKDGILADLLVTEMVAKTGKTISELITDLFSKVGEFYAERINFPIENEEQKEKILRFLDTEIKKFAGRNVKRIIRVDGAKLLLEDGTWVLFRPSGTEPVIRFYVEARSEKDLKELIDAGERLIKFG